MKKLVLIAIIAIFTLQTIGCAANIHTVGNGPQNNVKVEKWQWYALWGLVPINDLGPIKKADTKKMANTNNYEIKTEYKFLNILVNILGGYLTLHTRSVEVTK